MALTDREKMLVMRAKSHGPELFTRANGLSAVARVAQHRGARYLLKGDTVEVLSGAGQIEIAKRDVADFLATRPAAPPPPPPPRQSPRNEAIRAKVRELAAKAGPGAGLTAIEKEALNNVNFFGPQLGVTSINGEHL